ncbi:MAG TPA: metallophosphoesterase family protein [Burkholderiales bacterium]|nr:metallophosphoesterase family protein [Burkholderiales bacterium]
MSASKEFCSFALRAAACIALLAGCAATPTRFDFALIGDQQYDAASETQFVRLMDDIDRAEVDFVVHLGDFKAGESMRCDDGLYRSRREQFDASRHPLVYTPGDNEWSDCHEPKAGGYVPSERLAKLREIFFSGSSSLGRQKLPVESQGEDARYSKFRENLRWERGGVLFVTINMPGDNNNLGRTPDDDAEYRERDAANLAWLRGSFDLAKRSRVAAVALFTQANPHFERIYPRGRVRALEIAPPPQRASGFAGFLSALETEVLAYGKPVLFLHGDTHYFRIDKPLFRAGVPAPGERGRQIENFTRVEVFGFPEAHWLRIGVDPASPAVFSFREQVVPQNRWGSTP